jgi:AcrR family transcriptional regulator
MRRRVPPAPRKPGRFNKDRWDRLVTCAGEIFAEKGYQSTTIDDIASRMGLLPGSLYYYISGKEDLLFEVASRINEGALELTREPEGVAGSSAVVRLNSVIERWMHRIQRAHPWGIYNLLEREVRALDAERVSLLRKQRQELRAFLRGIIEQGIEEGDFDSGVVPSVAINGIMRLLGTTLQWFDPAGRLTYDEITAWYATFILRGLSPPAVEGSVRKPPRGPGARP